MKTKLDDRWKESSICGENGFLAYLLLGGNLGDVSAYFNQAIQLLEEHLTISKVSSLYKSEPWGFKAENLFLNQGIEICTNLTPHELLTLVLRIESSLGRIRKSEGGYSSRKIDIDILLYQDIAINNSELTIPHPRMHERKFALLPMVELSSNFVHPTLNKTMAELLDSTTDQSNIWKI